MSPWTRLAYIAGGGLAVISGITWMLQGFGSEFAPQSFMTNSPIWILIGAATGAAGAWLLVRGLRGIRAALTRRSDEETQE